MSIYKILTSLRQLCSLRLKYNNPTYDQQINLTHQHLELIEFNFHNRLNIQFLRDFFNPNKFPSLAKVKLVNKNYTLADEESLIQLLNQDYSHIRSFTLIRRGGDEFSDAIRWQILGFLQSNHFYEVTLKGVNFTELQQDRYTMIMNAMPSLVRSSTENQP